MSGVGGGGERGSNEGRIVSGNGSYIAGVDNKPS